MILKIFLSHSSLDYELVKDIQEELEYIGFDVFLAHKDIKPSKQWQEEIEKNLRECDILIVILTNNFKNSNWTEQEVGFAYGLNKKIISLIIDIDPYGFIGKWQGFRFNKEKKFRSFETKKIIKHIKEIFPMETKETLFEVLPKIDGYTQANNAFDLLEEYSPFNEKEINFIFRNSINNDQITDGFKSKACLKKWLENDKGKIDRKIKKEMQYILNPPREYDEIIERILNKSKLTKKEIEEKVKTEQAKLPGLLSKEGAAQIVASKLEINL